MQHTSFVKMREGAQKLMHNIRSFAFIQGCHVHPALWRSHWQFCCASC